MSLKTEGHAFPSQPFWEHLKHQTQILFTMGQSICFLAKKCSSNKSRNPEPEHQINSQGNFVSGRKMTPCILQVQRNRSLDPWRFFCLLPHVHQIYFAKTFSNHKSAIFYAKFMKKARITKPLLRYFGLLKCKTKLYEMQGIYNSTRQLVACSIF